MFTQEYFSKTYFTETGFKIILIENLFIKSKLETLQYVTLKNGH